MNIDIKAACQGKWAAVLVSLGYEESVFNGKHQPCPICHGKDRFRWHKSKEFGICNQGCSVQPMDLALQITGESYKTTAARIRGERLDKMEPIKQADDTEKNQAVIDKIKPHLKKLNGSDPASLYLKKRGLTVTPGQHVWYSAQRPSMVALFTNLAGELSTLHITYLTESGDKADIDVQKRFLPVVRTLIGSSIKLFNPENGVLAITEGIETALAVHQLEGLPVWAAGNATLLEAIQIPADVNEVWIYGDNDANFVGQKAAYNLANRLSREGKKVFVEIPNKFGEDFLDVLSRKQSETTARK